MFSLSNDYRLLDLDGDYILWGELFSQAYKSVLPKQYNVSSYKSNNLFIVYLLIYFLIFPQSELLSPKKTKQNIINLATFYLVHCVKLCHAVMCNRPCHVTCLVTTVNKPGRPNFCDS